MVVLFYAVAVFVSFLAGLLVMARLSYEDLRPVAFVVNIAGSVLVALALVVNLARDEPLLSIAAALLIALALRLLWGRASRPPGANRGELPGPRRPAPGYVSP